MELFSTPQGGGSSAGSVGENGDSTNGGDGGLGIPLPTFRNPSTVGAPGPTSTSTDNPGWTNLDDSGKYWVGWWRW